MPPEPTSIPHPRAVLYPPPPSQRSSRPAIIVVHNHPSGDPTANQDDLRLTQELIEAGKLLEIEVLDYLVIAQRGFVSPEEWGLGFSE